MADDNLRAIADLLAEVAPQLLARPELVLEVIEAVIARRPYLRDGDISPHKFVE